jgi:hypothetical protein
MRASLLRLSRNAKPRLSETQSKLSLIEKRSAGGLSARTLRWPQRRGWNLFLNGSALRGISGISWSNSKEGPQGSERLW